MMLSHPVLLGFIWSLLVLSTSGQSQISNADTNKVYAYSYHFQHNGTTNSKEILRSVLGTDPEIGLDPQDGKSIVKTFFSPGIRGFFSKGVLPAGPISQGFSNGISSPYSAVRRIVENNLQPPHNVATGLLPPISPDISREFPGDFNNVNHLGNGFQNQDDFPKIPPPPPPPEFPNNVGNRNVEEFSRDTPDGGKVVGRVETFSYNSPPATNSISRTEENSQGFRRNENILNSNREVTGHRTQSYFRQHYRTVTPNLESNGYNQNSRVDNRNSHNNAHNNNNQWWNGLNVLGHNNNNLNPPSPDINNNINHNINEIQNNINRAFGARLSGFRNNQAGLVNNNPQNNFAGPMNGHYHNTNQNFQNPLVNQINNAVNNNRPFTNVPNNPFARMHNENNQQNIHNNNGYSNNVGPAFGINNNPANINVYSNHQTSNNGFNNNQNTNNQYNRDTEKKVMNLIDGVRSHLNNLHNNNQRINNIGPTWDDDITRGINNDWSSRTQNLNRRPFSNGHSGPSGGPQAVDILKTTLDSFAGNRNFDVPRNQGDYRNVDGGGVEKFYGVDKVVEGPNSFSRNQHRGYERNFQVNSNTGYSRSNQWSTNTVRRLDAQSSKPDFSRDFIDVFRDDK